MSEQPSSAHHEVSPPLIPLSTLWREEAVPKMVPMSHTLRALAPCVTCSPSSAFCKAGEKDEGSRHSSVLVTAQSQDTMLWLPQLRLGMSPAMLLAIAKLEHLPILELRLTAHPACPLCHCCDPTLGGQHTGQISGTNTGLPEQDRSTASSTPDHEHDHPTST